MHPITYTTHALRHTHGGKEIILTILATNSYSRENTFVWTDSRGCSKQCLGFFWWKEKAATLKRRLCQNIYEPTPTSDCQQAWPNRWLVSKLDSLPKLERKARSKGPLKHLKLERNLFHSSLLIKCIILYIL